MGKLTEDNLITIDTPLKAGQRCLRIGNRIIPVGVGSMYEPAVASSDSVSCVSDIILGVVDSSGNFQPLSFEGTEASNSGSSLQVQYYKSWNSTLPAPQPSPAASMDFYKCTYVSSDSSMTWKGRKAVLNNGIYSFQSDSTEGLTYGSGFTPEIGSVYADEALIRSTLYTGYTEPARIFEAVLSSQISTAATGQNLTYTGTPVFVQDATLGRAVADFTGNDKWYISTSSNASWFPSGKSNVTAMVRFKNTTTSGEYYPIGIWNSTYSNTGFMFKINIGSSYIQFETAGANSIEIKAEDCVTYDGAWHTVFVTYDSSTLKIYLDRILKKSSTPSNFNGFNNNSPFWIGRGYTTDGRGGQLVSDVKLWGLCLTQDDINQISPD